MDTFTGKFLCGQLRTVVLDKELYFSVVVHQTQNVLDTGPLREGWSAYVIVRFPENSSL
jgi:hypothetical protein